MKLKNIFLVMFAAALAMVGCTKPIDFGDPNIKVTPDEEIQVPIAGGSVTVTVNTTRAWKLRDLPDWIVAEPDHGPASFEDQQVTLTFLENKKGNRYASIKFFAGIVSEFADIKQLGPDGETGGIDQITVKEFLEKADPLTTYRLVGKVSGFNSQYCSFDLVDETGSVYVFKCDDASKEEFGSKIKDGGTITITGKYYYYNNTSDPSKSKVEINPATIEKYEDAEPVDPSTIEQITVAEFLQKADPNTTYRLVGKVRGFNSQYCSFDLVDETGSIYVFKCDDVSKAEFGSKIMDGGVITITGKYYYYEHSSDPSKSKAEINPAHIEKYEDPGVIDPTTIEQITVAEFLQKADPNTTYRLVGKVSNFNSQYCSFDLTDESGASIYVFKCDDASKTTYGSKIKNGGTVTLTGKYYYYENTSDPSKSKAEINPATIEKYEDATDPVDPGTIEQITIAEFLRKADPNTTYRLVGKVSNFNSQYCSFDLTDESGASIYVFKCDDASKTTYGSKIKNGGTVTLTGKYYYYENTSDPSKSKAEINPATIEKYEDATDPVDPVDPVDPIQISCKDFNELPETDANLYTLVGEVTSITDKSYCNLYLKDATGEAYIYGLYDANKKVCDLATIDLKVGDILTVTGNHAVYQGQAEMKNGLFVSREKGPRHDDDPVITEGSVTLTFPDDNSSNNKVGAYTKTWVAKKGNTSFSIENFNNNNWSNWTYIKCGRKDNASVASISNTAAIAATIDKVVVTVDKILDTSKVNSFKLEVASDAAFSTIKETVTLSIAKGDNTFTVASPIANGYYRITFDCAAHSANGIVQISQIVYSAKAN